MSIHAAATHHAVRDEVSAVILRFAIEQSKHLKAGTQFAVHLDSPKATHPFASTCLRLAALRLGTLQHISSSADGVHVFRKLSPSAARWLECSLAEQLIIAFSSGDRCVSITFQATELRARGYVRTTIGRAVITPLNKLLKGYTVEKLCLSGPHGGIVAMTCTIRPLDP